MKKVKILKLAVLASIMLLIGSCQKGETGPAGKDGSANVTAYTYPVSSWSSSSSRWYTQLSVPELTGDNINSAAVQVYIGTSANNWLAIPTTVVAPTDYFWGFLTTVGLVEVRWDYNGVGIGSSPNTFYSATVQVKVVVIPPKAMKLNPNVNLNNYEEVKQTFNLSE